MVQTRLPFELDGRAETAALTAHGGVPLLIEAFRTSGAAAVVDASVVIKRRKRGLAAAALAEGLFSLWAAGGERCEDLAALREDAALALLPGHGLPAPQTARDFLLPAPQTARDFLEAFDEAAPPLWQGEKCQVQGEGERLQGLAKANRRLVARQQERVPQAVATIDVDATILESHQRSALATYDGRTGYQPVVAAEALPSQKFGANAAWFRLNVMLYNLLTAFKRVALPEELHAARPKRLRFVLLNGVGRVVRHARETVLRLVGEARRRLADAAPLALATGPPSVAAA